MRTLLFSARGVIVLTVIGLLGYMPGFKLTGVIRESYILMAPGTAISFFLLGGILLLIINRSLSTQIHLALIAIASLVSIFGAWEFVEYFTGMDHSFEKMLVPETEYLVDISSVHVSPATAVLFFLSGLAMIALLLRQKISSQKVLLGHLSSGLGSFVLITSLIFCGAYLYGTPLLYGKGSTVPMALTTALAFFMLGISIIAETGENSILKQILRRPLGESGKPFSPRRRFALLLSFMIGISAITVLILTIILYRHEFSQRENQLFATVQRQAHLVEAFAQLEMSRAEALTDESQNYTPYSAALNQITEAHAYFEQQGQTLEFTLAQQKGDSIVFLLQHRNDDSMPQPIPIVSEWAEPQRRALKGGRGTMVGFDYHGVIVLAAYDYVEKLNIGIVAKIDLAEIRAPFLRAALRGGFITALIVLLASLVFFRLGNPVIRRLEKYTVELRAEISDRKQAEGIREWSESILKSTLESTADGILVVATDGTWSSFNQKFVDMWGIPASICESGNDQAALEYIVGKLAHPDEFLTKVKELYKNNRSKSLDIIELNDDRIFERYSMPQWLDEEVIGRVWSFRDITQRNRAVEELQLSEERYRSVVQDQTEFLMRYLPDGTRIFVNDSYCRAFNTTSEQVTGKSFMGELSKAEVQRVNEKIAALSPDNPFIIDEHETKSKDGSKVWHLWIDRGVFDENGKLKEIQAVGRDITEHKQAEILLVNYAQRQDQLLKTAHKLGSSLDVQDVLDNVSLEIQSLLSCDGVTVYLLDESGSTLIPVTSSEPLFYEAIISTNLEIDNSLTGQAVKAKNGMIFNNAAQHPGAFQIPGTPVVDENNLLVVPLMILNDAIGAITLSRKNNSFVGDELVYATTIGVYVSAAVNNARIHDALKREVHEREASEVALRESEELNRSITQSAADAIITINEKGMILSWNQAAEKIFGYSSSEMLNMDLQDVIPDQEGQDDQISLTQLGDGSSENLVGKTIELCAFRRDGSEFPIELSLSSWESKSHKRYTGIIRDISNRKLAEGEIADSLNIAEQANMVKDQFIANISHEIRTPLNSILGFSDLFRQKYGDIVSAKDHEIFEYINNSSNRLMHTVDSILNIAQLNAGTIVVQRRELDLVSIIEAVVAELKAQSDEKNLDLTFILGDQNVAIFADHYCVHQAILNLTENAIKYTFEGQVVLRLGFKKEQVMLSIKDSGIGISEEYQNRIYQPYTQETEGTTKIFQGVGLGLALSKRYLELNDVELEYESKKDVGTTFTLIFPKYEGEKS
ncbi:PAS domain S-box protein [bacterium]|nr:PAS domain S-box protein [bacterium]